MDNQLKQTLGRDFRTTERGIFRIKRNLELPDLSNSEFKAFRKDVLLSTPLDSIETKGKNYYFINGNCNVILTVNSGSLTIITAKKTSSNLVVSANNE